MPHRPPHACPCPGCDTCHGRCPNTSTTGRCADCTRDATANEPHDRDRKRIYNSARWKALRLAVQRETPFCAIPDCWQPWTDLDHEPPLRDLLKQGLDPCSRLYVQPLCHPHHATKTAQELQKRKNN